MLRRNFNCETYDCPMCDSEVLETGMHLLFQCPYSVDIWMRVCNATGCNLMVQGDSIQDIWRKSYNQFRQTVSMKIKWQGLFSAVCWFIWRQRNGKIFEGKHISPDLVAQWIICEATLWRDNCGGGRPQRTMANLPP